MRALEDEEAPEEPAAVEAVPSSLLKLLNLFLSGPDERFERSRARPRQALDAPRAPPAPAAHTLL